MSAYMVDKEHIDILISVGLRGVSGVPISPDSAWYPPSWYVDGGTGEYTQRVHLDFTNADEVGAMLVATNLASIHARYPDTLEDPEAIPGPIAQYWEEPYRWADPKVRVSPVEALKALDGYEYQACEHEGWRTGEAKQFCDALRHLVISRLPGMREAPWTWDAGDIASRRRGVRV